MYFISLLSGFYDSWQFFGLFLCSGKAAKSFPKLPPVHTSCFLGSSSSSLPKSPFLRWHHHEMQPENQATLTISACRANGTFLQSISFKNQTEPSLKYSSLLVDSLLLLLLSPPPLNAIFSLVYSILRP